jgi:hypothetical protein
MRKKRKVSRVMGWLLSFQLSEPGAGAGTCCVVSMVLLLLLLLLLRAVMRDKLTAWHHWKLSSGTRH